MNEVVIVSAVRTAVAKGKKDGALAQRASVDLSALVMRAAIEKARRRSGDRSTTSSGAARCRRRRRDSTSRGSRRCARAFPVEVPAATINRFCSSGLQTVALARAGDHERHGRRRARRRHRDDEPGADVRLPHAARSRSSPSRTSAWASPPSAWPSAGRSRARIRIAWALDSQQKAARALERQALRRTDRADAGRARDVEGRGEADVRGATSRATSCRAPTRRSEGLAKLRPAFKANGTVTAGNASPYSDGAAAVLLMSAERAKELGLEAAGALRHVRGGGRRAGRHGRRPDQGGAEGAQARRPVDERHRARSSSTRRSRRRSWRSCASSACPRTAST